MDLGIHIRTDIYLRERLFPEPGEVTYLHLSDLRLALESVRTNEKISILDYGCGGSPYRSMFPNASYKRADYLQGKDDQLDYILSEDSLVKETDGTFDLVLSTQVIEHIENPKLYFKECFRLLKSKGYLYVTTHGTYPDHGCPYDFYRWTSDGLTRDLVSAGFEIRRAEQHTTGPRALFFHCDCQCNNLRSSRRTIFAFGLYVFRGLYLRLRPWLHRMCDTHFANNRVVTKDLGNHSLYIVTACLAQKP
jgi:SAM-dependent methyltransferase